MRSRMFTAALLALALAPAAASAMAPEFIETHIGTTVSHFTGDFGPNWNVQRVALSVGLRFPLVPGLALEPEVGFAGRGGDLGLRPVDIVGIGYVGDYDIRADADYIQVPILLRGSIARWPIRPTFLVGPSLSFKTGERYRVNDLSLGVESMATDDFRRFDWGVTGGAGLETPSPLGIWSVEARYTQGMTNILKPSAGGGTIRNRDVQLTIGLRKPWHSQD